MHQTIKHVSPLVKYMMFDSLYIAIVCRDLILVVCCTHFIRLGISGGGAGLPPSPHCSIVVLFFYIFFGLQLSKEHVKSKEPIERACPEPPAHNSYSGSQTSCISLVGSHVCLWCNAQRGQGFIQRKKLGGRK